MILVIDHHESKLLRDCITRVAADWEFFWPLAPLHRVVAPSCESNQGPYKFNVRPSHTDLIDCHRLVHGPQV